MGSTEIPGNGVAVSQQPKIYSILPDSQNNTSWNVIVMLEGRVRYGLMAIVGGCEGLVSLFIQQRVELGGVGNLHLE